MKQCVIPPKEHVASFDVDCQYAFTPECPEELPVPEGTEIVSELNKQAEVVQYRLGSKEGHSPHAIWIANEKHLQYSPIKGDNVDVRWVPHAIAGTKGFELLAGLPKITDYNFFVWKGVELDMHPYGSCYHDLAGRLSTGVIEYLRQHKVSTVIVGGLATDYCVKNTVLQLLDAKFDVVLNLGACRGLNPETTVEAKKEMVKAGARLVNSAAEIVNEAGI